MPKTPEGYRGEPTPQERNQEFRQIYQQIPVYSRQLVFKPEAAKFFSDLFEGRIEIPKGTVLDNPYTRESIDALEEENIRRDRSQLLERLIEKQDILLRYYSHICPEAIPAISIQLREDFINSRRPGQKIESADEVRFASDILLDIASPESAGVFDSDRKKVKQIEERLLGAYKDWCEIGTASGNPIAMVETLICETWAEAFEKRYNSSSFL